MRDILTNNRDRAAHATPAEWISRTTADTMLDRLMQRHHRITLAGESLRKASVKPKNLKLELDQN